MEIQVIGGAANKIAVAMVPFQAAPGQPVPALTRVAGDDLERSGQFRLVDVSGAQQPVAPRRSTTVSGVARVRTPWSSARWPRCPAAASKSVFICWMRSSGRS